MATGKAEYDSTRRDFNPLLAGNVITIHIGIHATSSIFGFLPVLQLLLLIGLLLFGAQAACAPEPAAAPKPTTASPTVDFDLLFKALRPLAEDPAISGIFSSAARSHIHWASAKL